MVLDQENPVLDLLGGEVEALQNGRGHAGPGHGVFLGRIGFADVVEQAHGQEQTFVSHFLEDTGVQGGEMSLPGATETVEDLDAADAVFVHGKEMVMIVLDLVLHRGEFRDELLQKAADQHDVEHVEFPQGQGHDLFEHLHVVGVFPAAFVQQVAEFPDDPVGLDGQGNAGAAALHKDLEQQLGLLEDDHGVGKVQPPFFDFQARDPGGAGRGQGFAFDATVGEDVLKGDLVELFEEFHVGVQFAQKGFHVGDIGFAGRRKSHEIGHVGLVLEMEGVALAAGDVVEPVSGLPDIGQGFFQGPVLKMGEESVVFQVPPFLDLGFDFGVPEQGVVVPQAAEAGFEIRGHQVGGVAEILQPAVAVVKEIGQGLAELLAGQGVAEGFGELGIDQGGPADEPGVQNGGENVETFKGHLQAFVDVANGIAHLKPGVPQGVEQFLDKGFHLGRDGLFKKDEQVNVRMDALFLAAVAAQGNDGEGGAGHDHFPGGDTFFIDGEKVFIQQGGHGPEEIRLFPRQVIGGEAVFPFNEDMCFRAFHVCISFLGPRGGNGCFWKIYIAMGVPGL